jgi:hypothetical protein
MITESSLKIPKGVTTNTMMAAFSVPDRLQPVDSDYQKLRDKQPDQETSDETAH